MQLHICEIRALSISTCLATRRIIFFLGYSMQSFCALDRIRRQFHYLHHGVTSLSWLSSGSQKMYALIDRILLCFLQVGVDVAWHGILDLHTDWKNFFYESLRSIRAMAFVRKSYRRYQLVRLYLRNHAEDQILDFLVDIYGYRQCNHLSLSFMSSSRMHPWFNGLCRHWIVSACCFHQFVNWIKVAWLKPAFPKHDLSFLSIKKLR